MIGFGLAPFGSPLLVAAGDLGVSRNEEGAAPLTSARIVNTTLLLFAITCVAAGAMVMWLYPGVAAGDAASAALAFNIGFSSGVVALSVAILTALRHEWVPVTAPAYALGGGVFAAGLAVGFEHRFPGIGLQALALTAVLFAMFLGLYRAGLITVTRRYWMAVFAATAAIGVVYLGSFVLAMAGVHLPIIHGAGIGGILWGGFVVIVATLNLVVDFDRIAHLEGRKVPPWAPWFVAVSLLVTLVWLYISVLRLLVQVRRPG